MRRAGILVAAIAVACAPNASGPEGAPDARARVDGGGTIDAVPAPPLVLAHTATVLYTFDVAFHDVTLVAPVAWPGEADQLTDLAVDSAGRVVGTSFSKVYSLDPTTAQATFLADLDVEMNGLAFVPTAAGEALYGATRDGDLYKINPDTGGATRVGAYGGGLGSSGDLAWIPGRGLAAIVDDPRAPTAFSSLALIDPSTGVATLVGELAVLDLYGIAHVGGVIFGFSPDGARVRIDPSNGATTPITSDATIWWGAGSRP